MPQPSDLDLENQLCFALYAASNELTRIYRPMLAELGLTYPQFLVMLVLWQHGPQNVGAIADRLRLAPNAITPLVDRLEAGGLVCRQPIAGDRRQVVVVPTAAGAALKADAAAVRAEVACSTGLSDGGLADLVGEIAGLLQRMDQRGRENPPMRAAAGGGRRRPPRPRNPRP